MRICFWKVFLGLFLWFGMFQRPMSKGHSYTTCTTKVGQIRRQHESSSSDSFDSCLLLSYSLQLLAENSFVAYFSFKLLYPSCTTTKFCNEYKISKVDIFEFSRQKYQFTERFKKGEKNWGKQGSKNLEKILDFGSGLVRFGWKSC